MIQDPFLWALANVSGNPLLGDWGSSCRHPLSRIAVICRPGPWMAASYSHKRSVGGWARLQSLRSGKALRTRLAIPRTCSTDFFVNYLMWEVLTPHHPKTLPQLMNCESDDCQ